LEINAMQLAELQEDSLLDRRQLAEALTAAGYPISHNTLATKASRGGGPLYQLFGRKPLYRWGNALAWARSRLTPPARSSSEHAANAERAA
jgi:hypothetical protein